MRKRKEMQEQINLLDKEHHNTNKVINQILKQLNCKHHYSDIFILNGYRDYKSNYILYCINCKKEIKRFEGMDKVAEEYIKYIRKEIKEELENLKSKYDRLDTEEGINTYLKEHIIKE